MRVRDFRTVDGSSLMKAVENEHGENLSHGTYKWTKVSMSAIFTHAKNEGIYDGINPMTGVYIPKGKKHGRRRLAYTVEEVEEHLERDGSRVYQSCVWRVSPVRSRRIS
jgi:hypothetical protein